MPKLSIVIPVYNTAEYLQLCIDSVLSQSFADFELILADNHSTDGSSVVLKEYAAKDTRVKYIVTDRHGKASQTRQSGLMAATGEFITQVDSDDSVKPGMYEHMFREQEKHDADIVVCNYDLVYPDKVTPSYSDMRDEVIDIARLGYPHYFSEYFCMPRPNNYLWSRIIRRSLAADNDISFPPVDISEDTIFTMLCTVYAGKVAHISNSYYNYFQREDSTMRVTIRAKNIASSYVYAFGCVMQYINAHSLQEVFHDILPVYAATRVRSILFYSGLAGNDDTHAMKGIISALSGSELPFYLKRGIDENLLDDSLAEQTQRVLKVLEDSR